jgi:hypothetical protein
MPASSRVTPIFLLSLPRSGSTLLQRMLATHPAVATTSEPWLLLPLLLGYREGHIFASYRQRYLAAAFEDFLAALPEGAEAHRLAVRRFAGTLYDQACGADQTHFLDKTPRYHLIADELFAFFPQAKFVLLWRNPLAVAASCIRTWEGGHFRLQGHRIDLFDGVSSLLEVAERHRDRLLVLHYEDLVRDPESLLAQVLEHCGLSSHGGALAQLAEVRLEGRMGDPPNDRPAGFSTASIDAWPATLATWPRRLWARRYLRQIGHERLAKMGYEVEDLLSCLSKEPLAWRSVPADLVWWAWDGLARRWQLAWFRRRRMLVRRGQAPDVACE